MIRVLFIILFMLIGCEDNYDPCRIKAKKLIRNCESNCERPWDDGDKNILYLECLRQCVSDKWDGDGLWQCPPERAIQ